MYQYLVPEIESGVTTHIRYCGMCPYRASDEGIWIKPSKDDLGSFVDYQFLHLVIPLWKLRPLFSKFLARELSGGAPTLGIYRDCLVEASEKLRPKLSKALAEYQLERMIPNIDDLVADRLDRRIRRHSWELYILQVTEDSVESSIGKNVRVE